MPKSDWNPSNSKASPYQYRKLHHHSGLLVAASVSTVMEANLLMKLRLHAMDTSSNVSAIYTNIHSGHSLTSTKREVWTNQKQLCLSATFKQCLHDSSCRYESITKAAGVYSANVVQQLSVIKDSGFLHMPTLTAAHCLSNNAILQRCDILTSISFTIISTLVF